MDDFVRSLAQLRVDPFRVLTSVAEEIIVLDRDRCLIGLFADRPGEPFRRETAAGTLRDVVGRHVAGRT